MTLHNDEIARALAENGKRPLTPTTVDRLRKLQAESLKSRWEAKVEVLRHRAPFKERSADEQRKAIMRIARVARTKGRKKASPVPRKKSGGGGCLPGWNEIATLVPGGFSFGSADTPQVVKAEVSGGPYAGVTANTNVAWTLPQTGQIALGVAAGQASFMDASDGIGSYVITWDTTQTLGLLQGNRSSASLTRGFVVPNLPSLAPNVLIASCDVQIPSLALKLATTETILAVWACGQATLDVQVLNFGEAAVDAAFGLPDDNLKSASDTEELFIESGRAYEDKDGNLPTDLEDVDPTGVLQSYGLSATIGSPPASSNFIIVTVSVEISAWYEPAPSAVNVALIDITGENTGLPMVTNPPNSNADMVVNGFGDSAYVTQPIQIANLRVCGH